MIIVLKIVFKSLSSQLAIALLHISYGFNPFFQCQGKYVPPEREDIVTEEADTEEKESDDVIENDRDQNVRQEATIEEIDDDANEKESAEINPVRDADIDLD